MNTKYQPKSIVELSEDDYTVSLAKKFIESLDCKETIGAAMRMDAFIAGAQSREVYICELRKERDEISARLKLAYDQENKITNIATTNG